jgi:para-aminobenzoate synthetase component 1
MQHLPDLPPFQGGIAGLFGYDLCHHIERLPRPRHDEFRTPDLAVGLYDWVFAHDHHHRRSWLIATGVQDGDPACRLRQVRAWLTTPPPAPPTLAGPRVEPVQTYPLAGFPTVTSNQSRVQFEAAIARGIGYVHAGDCFQVNLSQRLLAPLTLPPLEVYARLRERNPAPFAGFLDLGDFALASASPERFLQVQGREVRTRPIKGTRPVGATPDADAAIRAELLASAKDRAENVMIVDLLRNDLGRVCAYGTVRPTEVCKLETYAYVHHLVSEVRGELRPECDLIDLLRATFPGGSVTGAPKVRAMEIIAELEPTARGPYCGSLGYLGFDGSMDTNLLIRTLTLGRGWMQFPVGGGIIADSVPATEYEETLHKARGLLRVLDV